MKKLTGNPARAPAASRAWSLRMALADEVLFPAGLGLFTASGFT